MGTLVEIEGYLKKQGPRGSREIKIRDMRLLGASLDMRARRSASRAFIQRFARVFLPPLSNKDMERRLRNWSRMEESRAKAKNRKR